MRISFLPDLHIKNEQLHSAKTSVHLDHDLMPAVVNGSVCEVGTVYVASILDDAGFDLSGALY